MIEILNHKVLCYSQSIGTRQVSEILESLRQRMRNSKGYQIEFAFDEKSGKGELYGALRNPPSLENVVIHDRSTVMDLWFYSRVFQAKKIGSTFRTWTSICERLMAEKMVDQAFLTVGFKTMFDDLELFYRPTSDLDCAFEVKLSPLDHGISEGSEEPSCVFLNRFLGFFAPAIGDSSEFFVDEESGEVSLAVAPNSLIRCDCEGFEWMLPIQRENSQQTYEGLEKYVTSVKEISRLGCKLGCSFEQMARLQEVGGLPDGCYVFRFEGGISQSAKEFLNTGKEFYEGYVPAFRYRDRSRPAIQFNLAVMCEGASSRIVVSSGDEFNDVDDDSLVWRFLEDSGLLNYFAREKFVCT